MLPGLLCSVMIFLFSSLELLGVGLVVKWSPAVSSMSANKPPFQSDWSSATSRKGEDFQFLGFLLE